MIICDAMKCPKCKRKMIFNREIKDYYCERCKSSLEDIEDSDEEMDTGPKVPKKATKIKKPAEFEEPEPPSQPPPEAGTNKGLLFMMIGSLLLLIGPLTYICQGILDIIGFVLLILGFYILFKDRHSHSNSHVSDIKYAAVLILFWIIFRTISSIYTLYIQVNFLESIDNLDDTAYISRSITEPYVNGIVYFLILTTAITAFFIIWRVLAIRNLIQPNLKIILSIITPLIIISAFASLYIGLEYANQIPGIYEDTTKDELVNNPENLTEQIDQNIVLNYSTLFLNVTLEAIMVLCIYWTYTHQRSKPRN